MKKILGALLALFCSLAFGATTLPVQLINPTGSTSGQAIVSTGASSAPAWGGIGVNGIAAIAANTVIGNATNVSASPTAFAMPSCTGAANALTYTSGTGFVCNSAINATQLGGATFASPPASGYGNTTPEPVAATTLSASANDALLYQNSSTIVAPSATSTTVTGWTKVFDRVNASFNAATGVFTAPANGFYLVTGQIVFASATGVVGTTYAAQVLANSVLVAQTTSVQSSTSAVAVGVPFSAVVSLSSGQTVLIQAFQNSGSSRSLSGASTGFFLNIVRLP